MNEVEENKQKKEEITLCISNIEKHRHQKDSIRLRKIICVTVICLLFLIVILIGGILANSLVIMSDSTYIFSYLSGLFISLIAVSVGKKPSTKVFTFGYQRAETIGKLISVISIWLFSAFIVKEGIDRINNPTPVDAKIMLFTSIFGLVCNLVMINLLQDINIENSHGRQYYDEYMNFTNQESNNEQTLLNKGKTESYSTVTTYNENNKVKSKNLLNILDEDNQSEFLYILFFEMIRNLLIVTSSIMINIDHKWVISDPICSSIIMIIVLLGTLKSSKNCIDILMEATPEKYQIDRIENYLLKKVFFLYI
jgi:cation diffusion facilitator family transporter